MAGKRTYGDACGIARALDLVGERWALMIVRELLFGAKRFTDLRTGLPALGPDVLTQRLRDLEQAGVIHKRRLPPPAASQVYELTDAGRELEPVLLALGRWGGTHAPPPREGQCMSLDSHIVSMRTLFRPDLAGDLRVTVELRLGDERFRGDVEGGELRLCRGEAPHADVVISGDPSTLIDVLHGRRAVADAREAGELDVAGDEPAALRFLEVFPLPAPAGV